MTLLARRPADTDAADPDAYGVLVEPTTLTIERLLPGPVERLWAYLTDSDLRRQWLAAGVMELTVGAPFELVWRNAELSDPPGTPPEGFGAEHRLESRIVAVEPLRRLVIAWGQGDVTFDLVPVGAKVRFTVTHRRVADRGMLLNVSAGWHAHLDVLVARCEDRPSPFFWESWTRLRAEYEARLPA